MSRVRPRLTRRRVIFGAVLAAVSGAVAVVRSRGYDEPWELAVTRHLARRVCAADRPDVVTPDEVGVAAFVASYIATMPIRLRRDFRRFLRFVEQLAPLGAGYASRFTKLAPEDQDKVLASLESHPNELIRGGFDAVKAALFMGYYRDPRTWSIPTYEGPRV
jgi:hypothetical protein